MMKKTGSLTSAGVELLTMTDLQEYIKKLMEIAMEHPTSQIVAFDPGDDFREPHNFDPLPYWSERDQVIYVDGGEGD